MPYVAIVRSSSDCEPPAARRRRNSYRPRGIWWNCAAHWGPVIYCHCSMCGRASRSFFATNASVRKENFHILDGHDILAPAQIAAAKLGIFFLPAGISAADSPPRAAASGAARELPARSTIISRVGDHLAPAQLGYLAAAGFRLLQDRNYLLLAESSVFNVPALLLISQALTCRWYTCRV
jgi:hypothetical protein